MITVGKPATEDCFKEVERLTIELEKAKQELENLKKARQTSRKMRNENNEKIVALVGYTNAGKSSTINSLLNLYSAPRISDKN